jgi:hypothetical protein
MIQNPVNMLHLPVGQPILAAAGFQPAWASYARLAS